MKRFYLLKFAILSLILSGVNTNVFAQLTQTFTYSGGCPVQTYSVQAGVFSVAIDMSGAKGGNDNFGSNIGGFGGRVVCTLATSPGQIINVVVGGAGNNGAPCCTSGGGGFGGCNGGAQGSTVSYYGGGGGGATDIRVGGTALTNRVAVAGGGGGAGYNCSTGTTGGAGGGAATAGSGSYCSSANTGYCGQGATQTAPGSGGTYCWCPTGAAGAGASGGTGSGYGAGGGGGGYFGGGGSSYYGGGGGGSSYTDPSITGVTHTQGYNSTGNGQAVLTGICTPPVAGVISGPSSICGLGVNIPLSYTGSAGGNWSSTNPATVTVSNTGVMTSLGGGTAVINYSLSYACGSPVTGSLTVTVNPTPAATTPAGATVCSGATTALINSGGGTWSVSNPFITSIGVSSGIVTGINPGTASVTYTLPTGCSTVSPITVLPSPSGIVGTTAVCVGQCTTLSSATAGGTWTSVSPAVATAGATTGSVCGVAGGSSTTIRYTIANGCFSSSPITVNALPTASTLTVTGSGHYCAGGSGQHIGISGASSGVNYQLYRGSTTFGSVLPGATGAIDFGAVTAVGTYTAVATNATSGCTRNVTGSVAIAIDPLPIAYTLSFTGGGAYCAGTAGQDLILSNTQTGILYQLYVDGVATGAPVLGTGSFYNFGTFGTEGVYTVLGFDAGTGCSMWMTGAPRLRMNTAPAVHNVTGGGDYCPYGSGKHIGLDYSDPGISYQIFYGSTPGVSVSGSSASLDFGSLTAAGTYTVSATNTTTGCKADMTGDATITIDPLPTSYAMGVGGNYCSGGTGADVNLTISDFNVDYQLYLAGTAVGSPQPGNGGLLDFGLQTGAGSYTVVGQDATTGCVANMLGTAAVSIDPLPTQYLLSTGATTSYCSGAAGLDLTLNFSDIGINYELFLNGVSTGTVLAGLGAVLDFGMQTAAGTYSVMATNGTTGCMNSMLGSPTITINALPTVYNVTGGGAYCAGGTGRHVGLDFSSIGVTYQLVRGATPVGSPLAGSSSGLDFGVQTAAGAYTIIATNATSGCTNTMSGTANITISTPPISYLTTSATSSYCAGGTGVDVQVTGSETGIRYELFMGGVSTGTTLNGTGAPIDFGNQINAGIYTVVGSDAVSGCVTNMAGAPSISINPLPTSFNVNGGGNYCAGGTGSHVGLNSSTRGVSYQLMVGAGTAGSPIAGTGAALDFGAQTVSGNYTIVASNVTTTCANLMNGTATIGINPAPTPYLVNGGGTYCAGGTGFHVGLNNSASGINYQLYNGSSAVGGMVSGSSGSALDFGIMTAGGTYMVVGTDIATGCTGAMTGTTAITVNALPVTYTVYGGGRYCAGGAGLPVNLSGSATGVNYQLYNGATPVGSALPGTGSMLDFGLHTGAGTYMIVATDAATTCAANMAATAPIVVNPLPVAHTVTGGGDFCAGGAGVHVGLNLSEFGFNYQLYNGSTAVGTPMGGAGMALDFGLQTMAGTYRIVATNTTTSCINNMTSTATVVVNPTVTPAVTIGGGTTVCNGAMASLTATTVNGGTAPTYQWRVNGVLSGTSSSFSYMPATGDIVTAKLTSNATCASPAIVSVNTSIAVQPNLTPIATIMSDAGTRVCQGNPVTFTAALSNEGTAPGYLWLKNSVPAATTATYTYVPVNGDVVELLMSSSYICRTSDTVFSNTQLMTVDRVTVPTVGIVATPGVIAAPGQTITLKAVVTNGGTDPVFQWFRNGVAIPGANDQIFSSNTFNNQDSISCEVTSSGACGGNTTFNAVTITLRNLGVNAVTTTGADFSVMPNPNNGSFIVKGKLAAGNEDVTLEVSNMLGQVVYRNKVVAQNGSINEKVQLSSVANGMYILNVRSGNESSVYHVVVEQK